MLLPVCPPLPAPASAPRRDAVALPPDAACPVAAASSPARRAFVSQPLARLAGELAQLPLATLLDYRASYERAIRQTPHPAPLTGAIWQSTLALLQQAIARRLSPPLPPVCP